MNKNLFSKSGIALTYIARDCMILEVGDKLPTINYYTNLLSCSRGIVQDAISHLHENSAIKTIKSGVGGTVFTKINYNKVAYYTYWDAITISLPLPQNLYFSSLTTAINMSLENLPIPSAFAHKSGSKKRMQLLLEQSIDATIVPESSSMLIGNKSESLNPPIVLEGSLYSNPFYLYTLDNNATLFDGMTVLVDPNSADQIELSKQVFNSYNPAIIEASYFMFPEFTLSNPPDAFICRDENWTRNPNRRPLYSRHSLDEILHASQKPYITPSILTNENNYRIYELLKKYLDINKIAELQKKVLNWEIIPEF